MVTLYWHKGFHCDNTDFNKKFIKMLRIQWSLTYPDTSVPKLTVRITEYPDKWDIFYICIHKWFPNRCLDKWIIRISETWLYSSCLVCNVMWNIVRNFFSRKSLHNHLICSLTQVPVLCLDAVLLEIQWYHKHRLVEILCGHRDATFRWLGGLVPVAMVYASLLFDHSSILKISIRSL